MKQKVKVEDGNKWKTSKLPKSNKEFKITSASYVPIITHGGTTHVDTLAYVREGSPD